MMTLFSLLAKAKRLRGTRLDPFGYAAERKMERRLIGEYEALLDEIALRLRPELHETAVALASLPEQIRGYGPIKMAAVERAKLREAELLEALRRNLARGSGLLRFLSWGAGHPPGRGPAYRPRLPTTELSRMALAQRRMSAPGAPASGPIIGADAPMKNIGWEAD